jgi:hypothetical protein
LLHEHVIDQLKFVYQFQLCPEIHAASLQAGAFATKVDREANAIADRIGGAVRRAYLRRPITKLGLGIHE